MEVENREVELETILWNKEQKLKEGVNPKISRLTVGMLFNNEQELQNYYTNHATEDGVTTRSS